jgi:hypothetical protein
MNRKLSNIVELWPSSNNGFALRRIRGLALRATPSGFANPGTLAIVNWVVLLAYGEDYDL